MLEKVKDHIKNHKKEYFTVCALAIGVYTISFISFRLGAQHGMDVFGEWISQNDQELYEQIDTLYKKRIGN